MVTGRAVEWLKYAHQRSGVYLNVGEAWWVSLHGPSQVHEVTVTEDPEGGYFGWRGPDKAPDSFPLFIWPSRAQVEMCFPYGVPACEIVRMRITAGHGQAA